MYQSRLWSDFDSVELADFGRALGLDPQSIRVSSSDDPLLKGRWYYFVYGLHRIKALQMGAQEHKLTGEERAYVDRYFLTRSLKLD